ncbi:MAG: hypothetical protein RIR00_1004 [Pseudomonadota bacterium]
MPSIPFKSHSERPADGTVALLFPLDAETGRFLAGIYCYSQGVWQHEESGIPAHVPFYWLSEDDLLAMVPGVEKTGVGHRSTPPPLTQRGETKIKEALRDLLATIELYTDCMSGLIDVADITDQIETAETLLGDGWEADESHPANRVESQPAIVFYPTGSLGEPIEEMA